MEIITVYSWTNTVHDFLKYKIFYGRFFTIHCWKLALPILAGLLLAEIRTPNHLALRRAAALRSLSSSYVQPFQGRSLVVTCQPFCPSRVLRPVLLQPCPQFYSLPRIAWITVQRANTHARTLLYSWVSSTAGSPLQLGLLVFVKGPWLVPL